MIPGRGPPKLFEPYRIGLGTVFWLWFSSGSPNKEVHVRLQINSKPSMNSLRDKYPNTRGLGPKYYVNSSIGNPKAHYMGTRTLTVKVHAPNNGYLGWILIIVVPVGAQFSNCLPQHSQWACVVAFYGDGSGACYLYIPRRA